MIILKIFVYKRVLMMNTYLLGIDFFNICGGSKVKVNCWNYSLNDLEGRYVKVHNEYTMLQSCYYGSFNLKCLSWSK